MITTITLNAALDTTYVLSDFRVGQTNRIERSHTEPGGKGVNVAKVLHKLEIPVTAGGFIGGRNGNELTERLKEMKLKQNFITVPGETRTCLSIIDETFKQETEILELGLQVNARSWEQMCAYVEKAVQVSSLIVLSGSLPLGIAKHGYAELLEIINGSGTKAILDTSGKALSLALAAKPFLIKPNEDEIKQLLSKETLSTDELIAAGHRLNEQGIEHVCISQGKDGAVFTRIGEAYLIKAPKLAAINTVGSGDAMVAGFAAGFDQNQPLTDILALAAACAGANALQPYAGIVAPADVWQLKKKVSITRL